MIYALVQSYTYYGVRTSIFKLYKRKNKITWRKYLVIGYAMDDKDAEESVNRTAYREYCIAAKLSTYSKRGKNSIIFRKKHLKTPEKWVAAK